MNDSLNALLSRMDSYLSTAQYDEGMEFGDGSFFIVKKSHA